MHENRRTQVRANHGDTVNETQVIKSSGDKRETGSTETTDHETRSLTPMEGSLRRAALSKFHLAHIELSHKAL